MKLVKTPEDRRNLEKEMYDVANKIVGNVGAKIDDMFIFARQSNAKVKSDMPCDVAIFTLRRKIVNHSEIMDTWTKWITAYRDFKKLHRPEHVLTNNDNPDLVIKWLQKPIINDEDKFQYKSEEDKCVRIRAYLTIYRVDCYPIEAEEKVFSWVTLDEI